MSKLWTMHVFDKKKKKEFPFFDFPIFGIAKQDLSCRVTGQTASL